MNAVDQRIPPNRPAPLPRMRLIKRAISRCARCTPDGRSTAPPIEAAGDDDQTGWFVEPSYRLNDHWGVYARYEDVEAARDVDQFTEREAGFNFSPVQNVVLKFDYRTRDHDLAGLAGDDFDGFDLGLGYQLRERIGNAQTVARIPRADRGGGGGCCCGSGSGTLSRARRVPAQRIRGTRAAQGLTVGSHKICATPSSRCSIGRSRCCACITGGRASERPASSK
jgi:hypothetical protein